MDRTATATRPKRATGIALAAIALALCAGFSACTDAPPAGSSADPPSSTELTAATTATPSTATTTSQPPTTTTTVAATTTSTSPTPRVPAIELLIPPASPPTIDGVVDEAEWRDAVTEPMSDGATARWLHSGATLYVAVSGTEIGAVNVVISRDDQVMILHSSAALGSALYTSAGESWVLSHGFSWCCRNATDESGPSQLLADEGWKANIGFAGNPGEVEFAIALPWEGAAVAVSSIRDQDDKGFWPIDLSADARDQLLGVPPAERNFNIEEWARLSSTG